MSNGNEEKEDGKRIEAPLWAFGAVVVVCLLVSYLLYATLNNNTVLKNELNKYMESPPVFLFSDNVEIWDSKTLQADGGRYNLAEVIDALDEKCRMGWAFTASHDRSSIYYSCFGVQNKENVTYELYVLDEESLQNGMLNITKGFECYMADEGTILCEEVRTNEEEKILEAV